MGHRDERMDLEEGEVKRKHTETAVRKRSGKVGSLWGRDRRLSWTFVSGCGGGDMSTAVGFGGKVGVLMMLQKWIDNGEMAH